MRRDKVSQRRLERRDDALWARNLRIQDSNITAQYRDADAADDIRRKSAETIDGIRAKAQASAQHAYGTIIGGYASEERRILSTPRVAYTGATHSLGQPLVIWHWRTPLPQSLQNRLGVTVEGSGPIAGLPFGGGLAMTDSAPDHLVIDMPELGTDPDFLQWARSVADEWDEFTGAYGGLLARLRDDTWWASLCAAAGVIPPPRSGPETMTGRFGSYDRKVSIHVIPTISSVSVGAAGLSITIAHRAGDSGKAWAAKLDTLRAAFKATGAPAGELRITEDQSGNIVLHFNDKDPFDNLSPDAGRWDDEKFRSLLGVTSTGGEAWIRWANCSGCIVGGVPGSGKTGSLLPVFRNMVGHAELLVFDGKAQRDLHPLRHIARVYDRSGDLAAPLDTLRELEKLRIARGDALYEKLGAPNFWNVSKADRDRLGIKPIFLVLDEAQSWLDPSGAKDKELKALQAEIAALVRTLVQKGRSAGIVVILTTQKPTSESIPTIIRDNASIRISFQVKTAEAATAVLGTLAPGEPNPADIPAGAAGRFVMEVEGQGVVLGQAGFIDPADLEETLKDAQPVQDQRSVAARLHGVPDTNDSEHAVAEPHSPARVLVLELSADEREALLKELLSSPVTDPSTDTSAGGVAL